MNKIFEWVFLILLAALGLFFWYKLSFPRFQAIDLSINQSQAIDISKKFLKEKRGVDIDGYKIAVLFDVDEDTDRYLQKTLGIKASQDLIYRLHYDLFSWVVRFFREKQKEEYKIVISSSTGEIIGFRHIIKDTDFRPLQDKQSARGLAVNFLKDKCGFNPSQYVSHGEDVKKFDNRLEYAFTWQNKDIDIPWDKSNEQGHARLVTNVTISGHEILGFEKYHFEIPDGFNRYVDSLKQTGQNLTLVFRILYLALITIAMVVVVNRKHQVVARCVKPFYIGIGIAIFAAMVLDVLNSYQNLLFDYPTTQSLGDYIVRQFIENVIGPFFIAVAFVLPALAGESLRHEISPLNKQRSFLGALLSSLCSKAIASQIWVGYLAAAVVLGAQALIFDFGFKHWGVWDELSWLTQDSTTFLPAFTALVIGFQASFSEETMFRLFAINLFKKYGVPTALAIFLSAAIWGFGHTGYEIFPMWFRGVEVTSIGIIMGIFYLRFGLACVIAGHFLIDSFLSSLPYLLKPSLSIDFCSAIGVLALPLFFAFIAWIFDKGLQEKPLSVRFNAQQEFNYQLLRQICISKTPEELSAFKKDLKHHGWDMAIIEKLR